MTESAIYSPVLSSSQHRGAREEGHLDEEPGQRQQQGKVDDEESTSKPRSSVLFLAVVLSAVVLSAGVLMGIISLQQLQVKTGAPPSDAGVGSIVDKKKVYHSLEQAADAVEWLPGWSPLPLPSQQFSGFLNADNAGTLKMHYWLVEAEKDPSSSPLVLWFNGGPGASSLYGLLVELGPFLLSDSSLQGAAYTETGIPQLLYNPNGWQKTANILALSMPPPIGFSYCMPAGPSATGNDCGPWSDFTTANATYFAMTQFFERYPAYKKRDVWIAGESYGNETLDSVCAEVRGRGRGKGRG